MGYMHASIMSSSHNCRRKAWRNRTPDPSWKGLRSMICLDHLLQATTGQLFSQGSQTQFTAFSHDSRQLLPGELFVAVRGERSNGHDYLLDAIQRGATGLLLEGRILNALS